MPHPSAGSAAPDASASGASMAKKSGVLAWALWDWGSAAFNAVVTTFVFTTFLNSRSFVDPAIVEAAGGDVKAEPLKAALAQNATTISIALLIAGVVIAAIAPVLGQRSDANGRRKFWLGVNTGVVVLAMAAMFFVEGTPAFLILGATLLAVGNVFFEIASVNYNAMIVQVSTKQNIGRVSGFGWGMGYVGGIVLLLMLLLLFIGLDANGGPLGIPTDGGLHIRAAILASAVWFGVFAIPLMLRVPEVPQAKREQVSFLGSYVVLARTIGRLWKTNRDVLKFLLASAVFRDGLAGVFTYGAILAAVVFGFSTSEVLMFGVAANVVAGVCTILAGRLDDRFGPRIVIMVSLVGLALGGIAVLFIGDGKIGFWVVGLILCAFVGPVQTSARTFLARITPAGREGEIFGLYATAGRGVSFLAPGLFGLFAALTQDTRFGVVGIVIILVAGLVLMIPVKGDARQID